MNSAERPFVPFEKIPYVTTTPRGGKITCYMTTLQAPLNELESKAIDRAFAEVKNVILTMEPETQPQALLTLAMQIIDKGFALRSQIENAFGAANRRAFSPPKPTKQFIRGTSPKAATDLTKYSADEIADALKALGLKT